ncbi:MAG: dTDP-4-dehydrorhamnose reductase [Bacteroidales bacterium]|jgi:dTDP-4-dehydrorhamnose reductase|nr:dTDP-4-dehydrorhamnose reductase [Bacteroidales bacterium]
MKIVVTGANGQLGQSIIKNSKAIQANWIFTDIETLDITQSIKIETFFKQHEPDILIHCAAYTAVDEAQSQQKTAHKINHIASYKLALQCKKSKCKMIHISTDYVFDGKKNEPYIETDRCKPLSAYGQSKLSGENAVRNCLYDAIILRTSWLYSEFGSNFMKTMLKLGKDREELNVVFDQTGSPTYAGSLALGIIRILQIYQKEKSWRAGTYHFSNQGICSWYDFAKWIMEEGKINCKIHPITTDQYPTPARRPLYSVLDKTKFEKTFQYQIPHWTDAAKECLALLLL